MKSINIVNKVISKELDISLNVVNAVNQIYWKSVRDKLMNYEANTLFIKHLGSITISKYKLYREIRTTIAKLRNVRASDLYKEETQLKIIDRYISRLKLLLKHRNELAQDDYNRRIHNDALQGDEEFSESEQSIDDEDT